MDNPSKRVVRFLIWTSLSGILLAALLAKLIWNYVEAIVASR